MEPTLFKYIFRYSWRQQVILLAMTAASFPFLYGSLELPKIIINDAIKATQFPKVVAGVPIEQVPYLLVLCGLFLGLVAINGGFKYVINVFKGQVGERMLRRLRYQLYARVLRFPLHHFRGTSQGELIAMISSEVEPLGGFIGDALAQPAFQGGTLITILTFMFVQDWVLGLAAVALYPLQAYVIPKLQRQVNALAKERVRTVRKLSERIGETVSAIEEVHANDTAELHRAEFAKWVGTIYAIRFKIYRKKFFIKFLNNFIAQLTPFFFFSIGGYLVIKGELTLGALVAVLAAYKDLSSPWKELLDWYQIKEDTRVKYEQLIEQFQPKGMLDEGAQQPTSDAVPPLAGHLVATNLIVEDDAGVRSLDGASFSFRIGESVAIVGGVGANTGVLAKVLARLIVPTAGSLRIGEMNMVQLPEAVVGRRIGYVGQNAQLLNGTIRVNLLYGLKHVPLRSNPYTEEKAAERERFIHEARESGNTLSDLDADWVDLQAAGVSDAEALEGRLIEVLKQVDMERDIFTFGLQGTIDPVVDQSFAAQILIARASLRQRLEEPRYRGLVEPFDRERYNENMSVAENVLFGYPVGDAFDLERLGENDYVRSVLSAVELDDEFLEVGLRVARLMIELFQDLAPGHEFFERYSFISSEDLPEYQSLIRRIEAAGVADISAADRGLLMSLPFKLIAARHRLGILDERRKGLILKARHLFAMGLPAELQGAVAFFDSDCYNPVASVQDNILFGKLAYGRQLSQRQVGALIEEVLDALGLRRQVIDLGLEFSVGIGGGRLSAAQRQKLAIGRALLKRPDILILDQASAVLDPQTHKDLLDSILGHANGSSVVWVLGNAAEADRFDRVLIMEGGRVEQQQRPAPAPAETTQPATENALE
jgi:ABC-type multidrug transport system fused ATPase/permease subunit